jgi:hypothetical protein
VLQDWLSSLWPLASFASAMHCDWASN